MVKIKKWVILTYKLKIKITSKLSSATYLLSTWGTFFFAIDLNININIEFK